MGRRDHRRVHAHRDAVRVLLGDREQLDDVSELAGRGHVRVGQLADSLAVDVTGDDPGAERDRGDDRGLGCGVEALDVGGRVALREAERLRLGERVAERGALLGHTGEDVVGRAVDDPHDPVDPVARERFAQRAHERDPARDRRLEEQVDSRGLGRLEELLAEVGEQLLVRGDHGLPDCQRLDDELAGRLDPADDLDDDVDVLVVDDRVGVVGEDARGQRDVALARQVPHRDAVDLQPHPGAGLDRVAVVRDQAHQRGAHVPAAEQPDPYDVFSHRYPNPLPAQSDPAAPGPALGSRLIQPQEVIGRLAPYHEPGLSVPHEDDGRAAAPCCSCWPSSSRRPRSRGSRAGRRPRRTPAGGRRRRSRRPARSASPRSTRRGARDSSIRAGRYAS